MLFLLLKRVCQVSATVNELWNSDLYLRIGVTKTFEQAKEFARSVAKTIQLSLPDEYLTLETHIHTQQASLPPLYDPQRLRPLKASGTLNPHTIFGHIMLYGSGLVLHSSLANHNSESRAKMLECTQALIDICTSAHDPGQRRLYLGLANAVHMMNAIRVISQEIQHSKANRSPSLLTNYCSSIELMLDFLDDVTVLFPAWANGLVTFRRTLTATASSLNGQ
ncbi:hypothetical protein DL93DRAFT_1796698 [Clavulina sp. PMI_390]|nr:hypothetical protein DL93DRAFT_1796698 [Clavulina sp. PMI_390]